MGDELIWLEEPPALRQPVLLVALEGFVDAGAVAANASRFLRHRWQAGLVARFDRDLLLDYRARRPTAVVDSGTLRRVEWPAVELFAAVVDGPCDVLLLLGPEPDMAWEAFCAQTAACCTRLGVSACVGLGAYPAAVPHTRPTRVLHAANTVPGGLPADGPPVPGYTGPVGASTALQATLAGHGIPAVGLWAEVPHYVAASSNPQATLAMVRAVTGMLGTSVDVTELEAAAAQHAEQVDGAVADHPEAAELVAELERHHDSDTDEDVPSGDAVAAEIERYLRDQSGGGD